MTEAVVHELEVVDVDEEHADRVALARTPVHGGAQSLLECHPVWPARQRVVEGDVMELALRRLERFRCGLPLADVRDDAVGEEPSVGRSPRTHAIPDPARPAVVADEPVLDLRRLISLEALASDLDGVAIVRVDGVFPGLLRRAVGRKRSEQALEPFSDEGVAHVRAVGEVHHLVEVNGHRPCDAAQNVRRGECLGKRLAVAVSVESGTKRHPNRAHRQMNRGSKPSATAW